MPKKESEFDVTPYDVKGKVNYDKLIEQFGVKKLTSSELKKIEKLAGELHPYFKREIYFAHRDLKKILNEYEKGNKFFLYTGVGPSGPIHIGHIGTWLLIKWLQDKFDTELWFQFTDDEKFLYKNKSYEEIQKWTYENMLDIIALGFNPKKTFFLVDTKHSGIMYPEAIKVAKKITFSTIKSSFGFNESNNIGSIFFTAMQTVPIFLPNILRNESRPCLIPLAIDQDPHFRLARDVIEKLGHKKPGILHAKFMPALTGPEGKMSSSESDKAILLTDSSKEVERKIKKYAFSGGCSTIEEHRKKGGNTEIDVSYQWLKYFEYNDKKLEKIKKDYESGKMLSSEIKQYLIKKINEFLKQHQKNRKKAEKQIDKFLYKI